MRVIMVSVLVLILLLFAAQTTHAVYNFGGLITLVTFSTGCNDLIMVVVGVKGGLFEFDPPFIWYTLPFPPHPGAYTLGIATSPAPCSNIVMGGSSP